MKEVRMDGEGGGKNEDRYDRPVAVSAQKVTCGHGHVCRSL